MPAVYREFCGTAADLGRMCRCPWHAALAYCLACSVYMHLNMRQDAKHGCCGGSRHCPMRLMRSGCYTCMWEGIHMHANEALA